VSSSISNSSGFVRAFALVVVLGTALFALGSEILVRRVYLPRDHFEAYRTLLRSTRAPVVAFGDSHVANAIESSDAIANLGFAGETLPVMLTKAEVYVASGRGRRVALQLAPQQFALYRLVNTNSELAKEFFATGKPWLQFLRPHFRRYLLRMWWEAIRNPRFIVAAPQPSKRVGHKPVRFTDLSAAEQQRRAELRVQLHAPLPLSPASKRLLASAGAAIDAFRRLGIDICILRYPQSSPYRTAAAAVPAFEVMHQKIAALANSKAVTFVDLSAELPDSAFSDPDHVGASGRKLVTRLVLDRCFGLPRSVAQGLPLR